jgi:excinuclease ABC subunit C
MSLPSFRSTWLKRSARLPTSPGVYLMKDSTGRIIYVGKAKNLRARVRSYFQEGQSDYRVFVALLEEVLADLETIVTPTEKSALLLERQLIQEHEPRFNVVWRDDKQYICLRVDVGQKYPRVETVRHMRKDGARYFGPYDSATAARNTLRVLNRHFQLRTCTDTVFKNRSRPCLEYQIGRCPAPCVYDIDESRYKDNVADVLLFLEGRAGALIERLTDRMWAASRSTDYELAAHYRDQLESVQRTLESQEVALPSLRNQDVYGLHREELSVSVAILEVREGRVRSVSSQYFPEAPEGDLELLTSLIGQRALRLRSVPQEILVPVPAGEFAVVGETLAELAGRKIRIWRPTRGAQARLMAMAGDNASHAFLEHRERHGVIDRVLENIETRLHLRRVPVRMECFDISHTGGDQIVGSMVVFDRGLSLKSDYRRFRVRSLSNQDDFAAIYEVVRRRLRRAVRENRFPDLMVIDGGKGQLNAALAAARDLGVDSVDFVGLAKARSGARASSDMARWERIFIPGGKDPVVLPQNGPELLLLARLRDEAHRFAVIFHRELRKKKGLKSFLAEIPGVGPVREKALLRHFGSLKGVLEADEAALNEVSGIGPSAARRIYQALRAFPPNSEASG